MATSETVPRAADTAADDESAAKRALYVRLMREVADLIEHCELPVRADFELLVPVLGDFDDAAAVIAGVAERTGVAMTEDENQVAVRLTTQSGGAYKIYKNTPDAMARHRALHSYHDSVQPAPEEPERILRATKLRRRFAVGEDLNTPYDASVEDATPGPAGDPGYVIARERMAMPGQLNSVHPGLVRAPSPAGPEHLHGVAFDEGAREFLPQMKGCLGCLAEVVRVEAATWPVAVEPTGDTDTITAGLAAKADEVASEGGA